MERRYYANKQYSRRECLEILDIPANVADDGIESKVLEILEKIDLKINPSYLEDCHRLPFKGLPKKFIKKLNRHKNIRRILLNKCKQKNVKPGSVNLPVETNIFINENLCLYYKKLSSTCKRLWGAGHISPFWVSKGLLKIKLSNESLSIITHDCGLKKLFPGNQLIEDN